jgi:replicative DNA helicase
VTTPGPRVPGGPHDIAVEQAILGTALVEPEGAAIVAAAPPEVFFTDRHRLVARAITALVQRGAPVDQHAVRAELVTRGDLEAAGGEQALAVLASDWTAVGLLPHHLGTLRERYGRRELRRLGIELAAAGGDEASGPVASLVGDAVARLLTLEATGADAIVSPERLADELQAPAELAGVQSGIPFIDDICEGLLNGNLFVIAGRPGMGKTAMALQIAHHVAFTRCRPVLFCSLEMTRREVGYRLLSLMTGIDSKDIRAGRGDRDRIARATTRIRGSGFRLVDEGAPHLAAVQGLIRQGVIKHKAALVVVDHLGKIQASRRESRYLEVGEVAQGLKGIAKQLGVPVVALAQLNRLVERRNSPRPQLADLRDSGNIEEEADAVMFVWTPEERPEGRNPLDVKLFLAKHRHGDTGERSYRFEKSGGRFVETSSREEPGWTSE